LAHTLVLCTIQPQLQLLLTVMLVYKFYLLTYNLRGMVEVGTG